jgi:hypothetical protein
MARKKKAEPVVAQVPETVEEVIEVPLTVASVIKARSAWRTWGAPARDSVTGESVVVPAGMIFEVLSLGREDVVAVHPITGVRVVMRRGMIVVV